MAGLIAVLSEQIALEEENSVLHTCFHSLKEKQLTACSLVASTVPLREKKASVLDYVLPVWNRFQGQVGKHLKRLLCI